MHLDSIVCPGWGAGPAYGSSKRGCQNTVYAGACLLHSNVQEEELPTTWTSKKSAVYFVACIMSIALRRLMGSPRTSHSYRLIYYCCVSDPK